MMKRKKHNGDISAVALGAVGCFLLITGHALAAMTATDYFNDAAAIFVSTNNDVKAVVSRINEGLRIYPKDFYLNELKNRIPKEQNKQQNQQKNDEQQKQDQQQQDQQKQQQQQNQQQKQDQGQSSQPSQDKPQQEQAQNQPKSAEEMTPQEAKMLLDAMKQDEQASRDKMRLIIAPPVPVEKDW